MIEKPDGSFSPITDLNENDENFTPNNSSNSLSNNPRLKRRRNKGVVKNSSANRYKPSYRIGIYYFEHLIKGKIKCILVISFNYFCFNRLNRLKDSIDSRDVGSCDDDYDSLEEFASDKDFEVEEISRMAENAVTMNKMAELKKQLQNLSMTRKNKQVHDWLKQFDYI